MSTFQNVCPKCDFITPDLDIKLCPRCGALLIKITEEEENWAGKIIDSKIRIIRVVGKGGMGLICEAEQIPLERRVAVKLLRKEFYYDQMTVRRFLKEAQAAARLDHPNIIRVIDFGQTPSGVLYLVMEYLVGRTLRDEIEEKKTLSLARTKQIAESVCSALSHAHASKVIHCDMKPENVFLTEKDGQEVIVVLDFGIAKIIGGKTQTNLGMVVGTAEYISPEQINGQSLDGRADLYALACVLYECLSGRPPYVGDNPYGILAMHLQGKFRSILELRPDLNREIEIFFQHALSRDVSQRYATAEEFKRAFLAIPEKKEKDEREIGVIASAKFPDFELPPLVLSPKPKIPFYDRKIKKKTLAFVLGIFAALVVFAFAVNLAIENDYQRVATEDEILAPTGITTDVIETQEVLTQDFVEDGDLTSGFLELFEFTELKKGEEFYEIREAKSIEEAASAEPQFTPKPRIKIHKKKRKTVKPPAEPQLDWREEPEGEFQIKRY
ncbi:MAG: serine/threonine-protein kinase [Patescibacteria group bacterium]